MPNTFYYLLVWPRLRFCWVLLLFILFSVFQTPFPESGYGFINVSPMSSHIGSNDIGRRFQNVDTGFRFRLRNSATPTVYQTTTPMFGPGNIALQKPSVSIFLRPAIQNLVETILNDSVTL